MSKKESSSFSNPEYFYQRNTFGKKYYVLCELVLYEYLSEGYFNVHPEHPSNIYNLIEYTFQPDEKGISLQPKDPKKSVKGTLMETKDMSLVLEWTNCIHHNQRRRDHYYLDIIRHHKKIIQNSHKNQEYDMQNIVEQDLRTNQSANLSVLFDQTKQFKSLDEQWIKKIASAFILNMEKTTPKDQKKEMEIIKEILSFTNSNYVAQKDQELVQNFEKILKLFNHQMVDQYYKKENIRKLIKSKIYYSHYSFLLYAFITQLQEIILHEININNIQLTKDLVCFQEQLLRNSINDLELVVKTLLEDYNSSYQIAITEELKHTLLKVFKFFQNEIDCFLNYVFYFITDMVQKLYTANQVNYILQALKNQQIVQYIGIGHITMEILENSKNVNYNEHYQKAQTIYYKLCNGLSNYHSVITDKINKLNATYNNNYSGIANLLDQ